MHSIQNLKLVCGAADISFVFFSANLNVQKEKLTELEFIDC